VLVHPVCGQVLRRDDLEPFPVRYARSCTSADETPQALLGLLSTFKAWSGLLTTARGRIPRRPPCDHASGPLAVISLSRVHNQVVIQYRSR
jgi:hypothetical protein